MDSEKRKIGLTSAGTINLDDLLQHACSNPQRLIKLSDVYLSENSNWRQATLASVRMYAEALASVRLVEESRILQNKLGLSDAQLQLANRSAILIMLGLSHYLQWAGFDIENPADHKEISVKLHFARQPTLAIGITLAKSGVYGHVSERELLSLEISGPLRKYYKRSFGIGVILGYLVNYAHLNGIFAAQKLLEDADQNEGLLRKSTR